MERIQIEGLLKSPTDTIPPLTAMNEDSQRDKHYQSLLSFPLLSLIV
jgi:hypothetical protein